MLRALNRKDTRKQSSFDIGKALCWSRTMEVSLTEVSVTMLSGGFKLVQDFFFFFFYFFYFFFFIFFFFFFFIFYLFKQQADLLTSTTTILTNLTQYINNLYTNFQYNTNLQYINCP